MCASAVKPCHTILHIVWGLHMPYRPLINPILTPTPREVQRTQQVLHMVGCPYITKMLTYPEVNERPMMGVSINTSHGYIVDGPVAA